ncbi:hypothetical protein CPB83DRAFT_852899 [Crepidotus variabilis]|uniref:TPR-like protein n=1 Tax=Crepidotus variabilis TaxID=179855 RepID=A0A9P6EHT7_9AGAR|nr:hypothetical protein CPB83DRAFT_852899 [Crepidotus variabilis]
MSFQGLISGSECAVPANPLSQVLKHTESDRSLQQDRISGPSSSRLQQLPGTSSGQANEQDLALARQFFEGNASRPGLAPSFQMGRQADLMRMAEMSMTSQPAMHQPWAMDQHQQAPSFEPPTTQAGWAAEFANAPQVTSSAPAMQQGASAIPSFQQRPSFMSNYASSTPMYGMGVPNTQYPNYSSSTIGKGKAKEVDFEAAFAQFADSMAEPQQESTSRIEEVDETLEKLSKTLEEANISANPNEDDLAQWESQFSQLMESQRDELGDYGKAMQEAYENDVLRPDDSMKFDDDGIPQLPPYEFEKNNHFFDPSTSGRSCLAEAKQALEAGTSLAEVALLREAAIQRGDLGEGGYEAWILLGETRNMDEEEEAGMRALIEGVRKAQEGGTSGPGLLSLAISFTNKSFDKASHTMLLRWFRSRFPDVPIPEATVQAVKSSMAWATHDKITELFLGVARQQHAENKMDDELQIGLGVLFYTAGEYSRAQDCFATALTARPKDYLLWNRLGSSLSNDRKPEEALGAYREALQRRPMYTRAIYNVGVACLNIGADREAAEHFLSAIQLQKGSSGETSESLWSTLRKALYGMDRSDLAEMARPEAQTDLDIFRKEGFEF